MKIDAGFHGCLLTSKCFLCVSQSRSRAWTDSSEFAFLSPYEFHQHTLQKLVECPQDEKILSKQNSSQLHFSLLPSKLQLIGNWGTPPENLPQVANGMFILKGNQSKHNYFHFNWLLHFYSSQEEKYAKRKTAKSAMRFYSSLEEKYAKRKTAKSHKENV